MRCEFELEEWGCASEIKQNLNKIKAAPCKVTFWQSVYRKSDVLELLGDFGRKRNSSEVGQEGFWWKKAMRRVGVAYRELIGSLYESWTIGIEGVYKWLIHTIIQ